MGTRDRLQRNRPSTSFAWLAMVQRAVRVDDPAAVLLPCQYSSRGVTVADVGSERCTVFLGILADCQGLTISKGSRKEPRKQGAMISFDQDPGSRRWVCLIIT